MTTRRGTLTLHVLLGAMVLLGVLAAPAPHARAAADPAGWNLHCDYTHSLPDDPIVYPGVAGASHMHDFFGAVTTDAYSTHDSLRASETTCHNAGDASGYWQPALLMNGAEVLPDEVTIYYRAGSSIDPASVQPMPAGLRMIAGDSKATAPQPIGLVSFTCAIGGDVPKAPEPFDCTPYGSTVRAKIRFPSCWDGVNLDSLNHKSHMAYAVSTGCPADHPVPVPQITLNVNWPIYDGTGGTLASGSPWTMHADFFDGWDPEVITALTQNCMNAGILCVDSSGEGTPVVGSVIITPSTAYDTSPLSAEVKDVSDPRGLGVYLHYRWTVNGVAAGGDSGVLQPNAFAPGDQVSVAVTPVDGGGLSGYPTSSSPVTVVPDLSSGSGAPGQLVTTVAGGGFGPSESVDLRLDAPSGPVLGTVTTDASGGWTKGAITLPSPLAGGEHTLYGTGGTSRIVGTGAITVVPGGSVDPTQLAAGAVTTFDGVGFLPGETVTLTFPHGTTPVLATADGMGSVSVNLKAAEEPAGGGLVTASAPSGAVQTPFTAVSVLAVPKTGTAGGRISLDVTGFGAGEVVDAAIDGTSVAQYTADEAGSVHDSLLMATTFGKHTVSVTGVSSGISRSASVQLPARMSLSPASGPFDTVVSVTSLSGWTPSSTVELWWDGSVVASATADATGSVRMPFTVPPHELGKVTMKLSSATQGIAAQADFTVVQSSGHPPTIDSATISGLPYTNQTFTAVAGAVSDPDGDAVTLHYAWTVNGVPAGGDAGTFSSSSLRDGDVVGLTIRTVDSTGLAGGSATASPVTVAWAMQATGSGAPGTKVKVNGYGFAPGETVNLRLDSVGGPLVGSAVARTTGNIPLAAVTLPTPLAGGTHTVYGIGTTSGIVGSGPLTVVATGSVSPAAVAAGASTTFTGTGFVPGETVSAYFPGGSAVTATANGTGSVSMLLVSPPEPAAGGVVTAAAPSSVATAAFSTIAILTLPDTGKPGDQVPLSATGYGAGEWVDVSFDGGPVAQSFAADAYGSVQGTLTLATRFGTHAIQVAGRASGVAKTSNMTLAPWATLSPTSGPVGTSVFVVSTDGWVPGAPITLSFGGVVIATIAADQDGSIRTSFLVPQRKAGVTTVKLSDDARGLAARSDFTVTS